MDMQRGTLIRQAAIREAAAQVRARERQYCAAERGASMQERLVLGAKVDAAKELVHDIEALLLRDAQLGEDAPEPRDERRI